MSGRPLPKQVRWFVVTNWNVDLDYNQFLKDRKEVKYIAWGPEVTSTGKHHHQAFMYLWHGSTWGARKLNVMGNWFGDIHCSVAPMRGRVTDNEAYCSKENAGLLQKYGEEPEQGCRDDLDETKDKILAGELTADDVAVENPGMFHQYGRTLDRVEAIALRRKTRKWMTSCTWYTGPTHSGKSHAVFKDYDPMTHYVKNLNEDWWDGYKGQETVILNEFRGQIPFSEMLDLIDKWPKTVKWRGKEPVPFLAKQVLVSSIRTPEDVYRNQDHTGEPWEQWTRRVNVVTLKKRKLETSD